MEVDDSDGSYTCKLVEGGVKDSKHAFRFNARCTDYKKRVWFASGQAHRCLNSHVVHNSKNHLVLDEINL